MRASLRHVVLCASALMVSLAWPAHAQAPPAAPIEVILQPRQQAYGAGVPLELEFIIRNTTTFPVRILKWRTPIGGILENFLRVTRGAQEIPYIGPLAKRGAPTESDYVIIPPGGEIRQSINLGEYYAIYEAGPYAVAYDVDARGLRAAVVSALEPRPLAAAPPQPARVRSNAAVFEVLSGRVPPVRPFAAALPISTFEQCNGEQQTQLKSALNEAEKLASAALDALKNTAAGQQPNAQRYGTWFGAHAAPRWSRITSHYEKIYDALANKAIGFNCAGPSCSDSTFAYVYATQPYKIYLCGAFWRAEQLGTDSRAGTIVHETSHFTIVAGTDDFQYGQDAAKDLARTDPERATMNADNHEYFAENTPNLPM